MLEVRRPYIRWSRQTVLLLVLLAIACFLPRLVHGQSDSADAPFASRNNAFTRRLDSIMVNVEPKTALRELYRSRDSLHRKIDRQELRVQQLKRIERELRSDSIEKEGSDLAYTVTTSVLAVAAGRAAGGYDPDTGGYRDSFRWQRDKRRHLGASIAVGLSVRLVDKFFRRALQPRVVFARCVGLGAAFEAGQGYFSPYDLAYDAAGCGIGAKIFS